MAEDKKLSELRRKRTLEATDKTYIVGGGVSYYMTGDDLKSEITKNGVPWGTISGNIDSQTDLKGKFDDVGEDIGDVVSGLATANQRIDTILANPGSTSGDLELLDTHVGVHGQTYGSAGDAIRANAEQLYAMKTGFDGVVYSSPAEMVQGCDSLINTRITNENDYIDQFLITSDNLFQRDKATLHGYYSATGAWVDSSGLNGMLIRIKPNTQYTISGSASYSATFNAEKTWIESYINTSNPYTFTSPNTAEFLYVAVPNVSSYPEKTIVNVGSSAIASYSEGYDVPLLANKCLQMGDVTPGSTDFAKTGTNLINKRNFESGYYYSYNYGQKITQASYSTIIFPVKQNFTYTYAGSAAHICFFTANMKFISGVLAANANAVTFTTPQNVKYISISPSTANIGSVRLNEGSSDLGYEAFRVEIPDLYTSWIFDYSKFKYPYIRDCKVMCNKATATTTAYYAGVDCGSTIDTIESRFIWESGSISGVVALIIQNNGLDKITDITDLSVHLVLDKDHVKVDILGDRYGTRYYQNIINKTFATPMALDGETEHKIVFSVDTSTEKVYVYIDDDANMSAEGTFTPDSNIASLADVIGPYATFEHFTTVDRDSVAMPMFTKFYCRDVNGVAKVYDFFDREDGQLQNTPQGIPYHLISTSHNIG